MNQFHIAVLSAALLLAGALEAQEPVRVRGVVTAFDGKMMAVRASDGKNLDIQLGEKTGLVFTQPMKLADIKPGDFLGITSVIQDDGVLTAYEVRRMAKPVNPGHRPFDGKSNQTMTNATVDAIVQSTRGHELTVTYEGGSQKIVVPGNASISMLVPGERSQLVPGAPVNLTALPLDGGKLVAQRIQISPPRATN